MKEVEALDPYDPSYPHLWLKAEHLGRYLFAADWLQAFPPEGDVLEVACGTGYGARELAAAGCAVVAVDRPEQVARAARTPWPAPEPGRYPRREGPGGGEPLWLGADLDTEDLSALLRQVGRQQAACACCFETLEHLADPERFLHMLRQSLRPGGTLMLSAPQAGQEPVRADGTPKNPYHRHLFSQADVERLLAGAGFGVREVYGQPLCNALFRREMGLLSGTGRRPGEFHRSDPLAIYHYARLVGYPERDRVEGSYALLWVAGA